MQEDFINLRFGLLEQLKNISTRVDKILNEDGRLQEIT